VEQYKWAIGISPLTEEGIRDFRNANQFSIESSSSGRIHFKTDLGSEYEKNGYNLEKLELSFIAEDEDGDKEFTILPYAHTDANRSIRSKSLIILSQEQREKIKQFIVERLND